MKRDSLAKNTLMLYLLQGSNYILALILVPYLTRILGAETYGTIGFATSVANVTATIVSFGFSLSATLEIAQRQSDQVFVSKIMTSVTIIKAVLGATTLTVVCGLIGVLPQFRENTLLILLYNLYYIVNAFMPDFVYRGLETMQTITVWSVSIKLVACVGIVAFVKSPADYDLVPAFYLLGASLALLFAYAHMKLRLGIYFIRVSLNDIYQQLLSSAEFFASRIAGTAFTSLNVILLGMLFPGAASVGFYSAGNTIIRAGRNAITPLSNSLFPHTVRSKNYRLLKKVLIVGESILTAGCVGIAIFSRQICLVLFGPGYVDAAPILCLMLPLLPIDLASYLLGWSVLGSLKMTRVTNTSVFIGAAIHIAQLLFLLAIGAFDVVTISIAMVITEISIFGIRLAAALKGFKEQSVGKG